MEDVIIITNPMIAVNESAKVTLSKFLRVIEPCCRNLQVLGGNLRIEGDLKQVQLVSVPIKYSLQGTTQSRYLTGGVPPVRFSM